MRICNARTLSAGAALLVLSAAFAPSPLAAASTLKKENDSSISMPSSPSMPSLSAPSIGSGFYMPGSKDFYSGSTPGYTGKGKNSSQASASSTGTANASSQESGAASSSVQSTSQTATSQPSTANALSALTSISNAGNSLSNQLTAGDISSLNNLGLFNSISGILGNSNSLSSSANSENPILYSQNSADSKTLQQILTELNELKNQVSQNGNLPSGESAFVNTKKTEPKILRFNVNGYDLLSTCRKTYFSEQESDGTFLLTGDRKYVADGKSRSETFYFYFKADGNDGGIMKYKVSPAVSQDYENQNSFLYQLMSKSELTAQRTGNLVTLRASEQNWKMDILLSLDR